MAENLRAYNSLWQVRSVEVLINIARELDQGIYEMSVGERERFERAVHRLTKFSVPLPDFSGFHTAFRDHHGTEPRPEGDVRRAFYLSYDDTNCEYLTGEQIDERLDAGADVVSATFVTPYPAGLSCYGARSGGYPPDTGIHARSRHERNPRLQNELRLPGVHREGRRDGLRCGGAGRDRKLPEIGQEELVRQKQFGDALSAGAATDDLIPEVGNEKPTGERYPGDAVEADTDLDDHW